jgi:hypothetical protein
MAQAGENCKNEDYSNNDADDSHDETSREQPLFPNSVPLGYFPRHDARHRARVEDAIRGGLRLPPQRL